MSAPSRSLHRWQGPKLHGEWPFLSGYLVTSAESCTHYPPQAYMQAAARRLASTHIHRQREYGIRQLGEVAPPICLPRQLQECRTGQQSARTHDNLMPTRYGHPSNKREEKEKHVRFTSVSARRAFPMRPSGIRSAPSRESVGTAGISWFIHRPSL